jgi:hypothetical protein
MGLCLGRGVKLEVIHGYVAPTDGVGRVDESSRDPKKMRMADNVRNVLPLRLAEGRSPPPRALPNRVVAETYL